MKKFLAAFAVILASCFVVSAQNYTFIPFTLSNVDTNQTYTSSTTIWTYDGKAVSFYLTGPSNMCVGVYATNQWGALQSIIPDTTNMNATYRTNLLENIYIYNSKILFRAKLSTDSNRVADADGYLVIQE